MQDDLGLVWTKIQWEGKARALGLQPKTPKGLAAFGPVMIDLAADTDMAMGAFGVFWLIQFRDGQQSAALCATTAFVVRARHLA